MPATLNDLFFDAVTGHGGLPAALRRKRDRRWGLMRFSAAKKLNFPIHMVARKWANSPTKRATSKPL
jgi:hypothetical protein